jgi:hypothetical protein
VNASVQDVEEWNRHHVWLLHARFSSQEVIERNALCAALVLASKASFN